MVHILNEFTQLPLRSQVKQVMNPQGPAVMEPAVTHQRALISVRSPAGLRRTILRMPCAARRNPSHANAPAMTSACGVVNDALLSKKSN